MDLRFSLFSNSENRRVAPMRQCVQSHRVRGFHNVSTFKAIGISHGAAERSKSHLFREDKTSSCSVVTSARRKLQDCDRSDSRQFAKLHFDIFRQLRHHTSDSIAVFVFQHSDNTCERA